MACGSLLTTSLLQADCESLLSTSLLQVVSTSGNKSVHDKLQQARFSGFLQIDEIEDCCKLLASCKKPVKN